mmetsp:Transcript_6898/g.20247  ORF Transcript_6898/g.20247 Transcript_6898/m.20247 type:complete len:204 (-) Transcript_6898:166-777(-)
MHFRARRFHGTPIPEELVPRRVCHRGDVPCPRSRRLLQAGVRCAGTGCSIRPLRVVHDGQVRPEQRRSSAHEEGNRDWKRTPRRCLHHRLLQGHEGRRIRDAGSLRLRRRVREGRAGLPMVHPVDPKLEPILATIPIQLAGWNADAGLRVLVGNAVDRPQGIVQDADRLADGRIRPARCRKGTHLHHRLLHGRTQAVEGLNRC